MIAGAHHLSYFLIWHTYLAAGTYPDVIKCWQGFGGPLNLVGGDIDWQIFWKAIFCEIKNV